MCYVDYIVTETEDGASTNLYMTSEDIRPSPVPSPSYPVQLSLVLSPSDQLYGRTIQKTNHLNCQPESQTFKLKFKAPVESNA